MPKAVCRPPEFSIASGGGGESGKPGCVCNRLRQAGMRVTPKSGVVFDPHFGPEIAHCAGVFGSGLRCFL